MAMTSPLSAANLRCIELSAIGPVPMAGMLLAQMGAQVVRINRPHLAPSATLPSTHNKNHLAINLKEASGICALKALLAHADVLLEGYRPQVLENLGLDPKILLALNPRLIIARMSGYGQNGERAHQVGHDLNYLALSGALYHMGSPNEPPRPPLNLVADYGAGAMLLVQSVLAGIIERHHSGQGQVIDVAMVDGVIALMSDIWGGFGGDPLLPALPAWSQERGKNWLDGSAPWYSCYQTADGHYISLAPIEEKFYARLLDILAPLGLPVETLAQIGDRFNPQNWAGQKKIFADFFRQKSREYWDRLLHQEEVCYAPVLSHLEAQKDAHIKSRQAFVCLEGEKIPALAPKFSRTPTKPPQPSQTLNREDLQTLMEAWQLSPKEQAQVLPFAHSY